MKAAMSPLMLAGLQTAGLLFSSHSQDEACGNIGGLETQQRILCPHALASPACCQAERSEQVEAALCRCEDSGTCQGGILPMEASVHWHDTMGDATGMAEELFINYQRQEMHSYKGLRLGTRLLQIDCPQNANWVLRVYQW